MNDPDLRFRLRQLPREIEPGRDLWPDIAARLQQPPRRSHWRPMLAAAAVAALAIAIGAQLRTPESPVLPDPAAVAVAEGPAGEGGAAGNGVLQREAHAMAREYDAALREYAGAPVPEDLQPVLATLDASADQIQEAIARDPDAPWLLDRLRSTYSRRLQLTQRAVTG
ncbi:hypothetical protein [Arenimonas composti]|uniref:Uncharacterized protein n=1 Tax=Arenimonas composti TR7-09 = DSM 18010 TaxID=1121013 RepID=A0A091BJJ7_9GAMM|nr:hypothetical protein [Arenimonas composti]KFN50944.1 hypothetical protein P873_04895 [Arenimonas composti TR7-09 = DSM 18010]